nr:theta defensin-1 - rhesus macaque [Macaca mulatta]
RCICTRGFCRCLCRRGVC